MQSSTSERSEEVNKDSDSEHVPKKMRTECAVQLDTVVCPAIADQSGAIHVSNPLKATVSLDIAATLEVAGEVLCAICMGADGEEIKLLKSHNCPVCVAGAWQICDVCDDNLLSRSCPVCNSDYSPRILYLAPGMPTFPISTADIANPQLIRKICAIGKLVSGSNVVVWCPSESKMHFFLPQEFTDNSSDFRSLSVVIAMSDDKICDGQFLFCNSVWDELLKEMEEGPTNSDEILSSKDTMKKIFTTMTSPGSQLLTQLKPEEWSMFDD